VLKNNQISSGFAHFDKNGRPCSFLVLIITMCRKPLILIILLTLQTLSHSELTRLTIFYQHTFPKSTVNTLKLRIQNSNEVYSHAETDISHIK